MGGGGCFEAAYNQSISDWGSCTVKQSASDATYSRLESMVAVAQDPYAYIDPTIRACHTGTEPRHFRIWRCNYALHKGVR